MKYKNMVKGAFNASVDMTNAPVRLLNHTYRKHSEHGSPKPLYETVKYFSILQSPTLVLAGTSFAVSASVSTSLALGGVCLLAMNAVGDKVKENTYWDYQAFPRLNASRGNHRVPM